MINKRKIISLIIAVVMIFTTGITCTVNVSAESSETGGLMWNYKDTSNSAMTGISSPVYHDGYIYAASGKTLYKIDAVTGEASGKTELTGSVGYNKIAPTVADTPDGIKIIVPMGAAKLDIVDDSTMTVEKHITYAEGQSGHQTLVPAIYDETDNSIYVGSWRKLREGADYTGGTFVKVSLYDYSITKITDHATGFYWSGAYVTDAYVMFGSVSDGSDDPNTPSDGDAVLYVYEKATGNLNNITLEDSGSICSAPVGYGSKYYVTSKCGNVYMLNLIGGEPAVIDVIKLGAKSTCTPVIADGVAYVGAYGKVFAIDLDTEYVTEYKTPGDVKNITVSGDKVYATYNTPEGGIYDVKAGVKYFVPAGNMQNYCISSIAASPDGILYYTNDSNNIFAVKPADELITAEMSGTGTVAYTGSAQEPAVDVMFNGKLLEEGTDYTVTYSDNKYPGTASATVKAKGDYYGTVFLNFTIKKPSVAAQKTVTANLTPSDGYNDFTVKWSAQSVKGAAVKYKVEYQKYGGAWKTIYSATTKTSLKKTNLTNGAKYRFRVTPFVTVNGITYKGNSKTTAYTYTLKKTSKPVVKKASASYVKVSWSQGVNGITGYKIYRSKSSAKNFKLVKTVSSKYKYAKVKTPRKTKYYYKVRPYKVVNGKTVYGPWSTVSKPYILK